MAPGVFESAPMPQITKPSNLFKWPPSMCRKGAVVLNYGITPGRHVKMVRRSNTPRHVPPLPGTVAVRRLGTKTKQLGVSRSALRCRHGAYPFRCCCWTFRARLAARNGTAHRDASQSHRPCSGNTTDQSPASVTVRPGNTIPRIGARWMATEYDGAHRPHINESFNNPGPRRLRRIDGG